MARIGVLAVAVAVVATPLFSACAGSLAGIVFENVRATSSTVPVLAVWTAAALFAAAWGFLLAGSALGPGLLWVLAGLQYVYGMITIGLSIGRSYLHLVPILLPVLVGAVSPGGRPWARGLLLAAIASITIRLSPLPSEVRAAWYLYWLPVAGALALAHAGVARLGPWPSARRVALGALVTLAYMGTIALSGDLRSLTEWFHTTLDNLTSMLQVVWFLLGATFIAGAIELGRFAQKAVEAVAPASVPPWGLLVAWSGVVAWVALPAEPSGARIAAAAVALGALVVLAVRWRARGVSREWLAGWFVASLAAMFVLRAHLGLDLSDIITREAGVLSIAGFIYAVVWEVTGRLPSVPVETPHFGRPAPLALYLGTILLIGAAALFGLAANLKFFQQIVVLGQYMGALALWIPVALLTLAGTWRRIPRAGLARFPQAFGLSAVATVPAFLWRASGGGPAADLCAALVALAFAIYLIRIWPEASDRVVAGGIGAAVGFGLAAHLETGIPSVFLHGLLVMVAALAGVPQVKAIGDWVLRVSSNPPWGPQAEVAYYWILPWLVAAVSATTAVILGRGRPVLAEGSS